MLNMDPLERQVWRLLTVVVFISVINVPLVSAYCWQAGQNPYFTAQPIVQQVDLRTVRVTWEGIVEYERCVDNYIVKYWQKSNPQGYKMTELIDKQHYTTDIIITPKVNYVFQVITREDKGALLGIDYNKSDRIEFKTSSYNSNVKPTTPKPALEPTVVPNATGTENGIITSPDFQESDQIEFTTSAYNIKPTTPKTSNLVDCDSNAVSELRVLKSRFEELKSENDNLKKTLEWVHRKTSEALEV